jgi:hypothetical protein
MKEKLSRNPSPYNGVKTPTETVAAVPAGFPLDVPLALASPWLLLLPFWLLLVPLELF